MAVINPFNYTTPDTESYSRLFLRQEELQYGIAALFEAVAKLKSIAYDECIKLGYSWADVTLIIALGAKPDTVLNLATRLSVTKQALTKTIRNLEELQIIARKLDNRDKRRNHLSLTKKGIEANNSISKIMRSSLAKAYRMAGAEAVFGSDQVLWSIIRGDAPKSGENSLNSVFENINKGRNNDK